MSHPLSSDKAFRHERSLGELSEDEISEIVDEFSKPEEDETAETSRGGPASQLLSFLGFWRSRPGRNLRVGMRKANGFIPADKVETGLFGSGDSVNIVMRQLFMPDLPQQVRRPTGVGRLPFLRGLEQCVAHLISCDASSVTTASTLGAPVFRGLRGEQGLDLSIKIYAMAERQTQPILELLDNDLLKQGLQLGGKFNPVFGMTVPYIDAVIRGLTMNSRRNFKVAEWRVGFGFGLDALFPLAASEYILLDGNVGTVKQPEDVDWDKLAWLENEDRPVYKGERFNNPYLMFKVTPDSPPVAA